MRLPALTVGFLCGSGEGYVPKAITVKKGATVSVGQCFFPATINKVLVCHLSISRMRLIAGRHRYRLFDSPNEYLRKSRKVRAGNCIGANPGVRRDRLYSLLLPYNADPTKSSEIPRDFCSHICASCRAVSDSYSMHTVAPFAYRSIMALLVAGDCTLRNEYSRGPVHASGGPERLRMEARRPPNRLQPGHPSTKELCVANESRRA